MTERGSGVREVRKFSPLWDFKLSPSCGVASIAGRIKARASTPTPSPPPARVKGRQEPMGERLHKKKFSVAGFKVLHATANAGKLSHVFGSPVFSADSEGVYG